MLIYKYDFPCIFFFKTLAYSILRKDIIQVMMNVILHDVNRSESWTKRIYTSAQTYIEESSLMLLLLLLLLLLWCCCRATNIHIHIFSCTVYFSLLRIFYVKENITFTEISDLTEKSTLLQHFSIKVERWSLKHVNEYKTMIFTFFTLAAKNNNDAAADNLRLKKL